MRAQRLGKFNYSRLKMIHEYKIFVKNTFKLNNVLFFFFFLFCVSDTNETYLIFIQLKMNSTKVLILNTLLILEKKIAE